MNRLYQFPSPAPTLSFTHALPASLVEGLAKRIAVARGELSEHESVEALGELAQTYRGAARLLLNPDGAAREAELRLRMSIAQVIHGCDFDKLDRENKVEVAEEAHLALVSVLETFAGPRVPLTEWRRQSLLLDTDPEWAGGRYAV